VHIHSPLLQLQLLQPSADGLVSPSVHVVAQSIAVQAQPASVHEQVLQSSIDAALAPIWAHGLPGSTFAVELELESALPPQATNASRLAVNAKPIRVSRRMGSSLASTAGHSNCTSAGRMPATPGSWRRIDRAETQGT
jgi:hypothetical protein